MSLYSFAPRISEDKEPSLHCEEDTLWKDSVVRHTVYPGFDAMENWSLVCTPHVTALDI